MLTALGLFIIFPLIEQGYELFSQEDTMPLDLNTLINDEFDEIKFNDEIFRVPGYLPAEAAGMVIDLQKYGDISSNATPGRFRELYKRERKVITAILTAKRNGKPINRPGAVKRFVKSLETKDVNTVFTFIFQYFKACEDKKKAE